jgi:hypothetical protein
MPRRSAAVAVVRCPRRSASRRRPSQHDRPPVRSRREQPSPSRRHALSSCLTCPSVPKPQPAIAPQAHPTRVSALSGQDTSPYPAGYPVTAGRGASIVVTGFPLPFGHRHSLLGSSCARWDIVHPHGRPTSRSDLLRLDPIGVVTFRMKQKRPGRVPSEPRGRWCAPIRPDSSGRHPPPSNGRPLSPAAASHRAEVPMTRRHRGFTHVHPSGLPQPVTPGWNRNPWAFHPRASHPTVTRDAPRGGDGPCARDRTLHPRRHAAPPSMSVAVLMRLTCRTIWFNQEACTGVWTMTAFGKRLARRSIAA